MLGSDTRYAVQNFYAVIDDVEFCSSELSSRWTQLGEADRMFLRDRLLERAQLALRRANDVLARPGNI